MRLLIAALMFVLFITPTFFVPPPSQPQMIHHPITRSLEYVQPEVVLSDHDAFLNFSGQRVHLVLYGTGDVRVLVLPGFGRTAERTYELLQNFPEFSKLFTLYILDPPGMGLSSGPAQTPENFIGNGTISGSYFRRYARFAYEAAITFNVSYVVGASLGGIITYMMGYFLDDLEAIMPIMSAGYRKFSLSRAEAINRFVRSVEDRVIDAFDPAVFAPFIKVPTYIIAGAEDEVFDPYTFIRTYELINVNKSLVILPHVGHGPYSDYFYSLLAIYHRLHGERGEMADTYYVGSRHMISTSVPVDVFGLKVVLRKNSYGYYRSEVIEYSSIPAAAGYLFVLIVALAYLYSINERRSIVYAALASPIGLAYAPGRFTAFTVPTLPLILVLSGLLLTLSLLRRWLGIAAFFPRVLVGAAFKTLILPGPFFAIFFGLAIGERILVFSSRNRSWGGSPSPPVADLRPL